MTNLGSLTTTFTPPASCTTNTPQIYQVWKGSTSQYIHGPLYTPDSNCFPDGYNVIPTNYYNPGFCPKGYTAAPCSHSGLPVTETEAAGVTQTAVLCCPSGAVLTFTCADNTAQALACTTTFPKGAEVEMGVTVISDGTIGAHTTVFERRGGIGAYGIQVVLGAMQDGRIQTSEQDNSGTTATATSLPTTPQPTTTADPSATTTSSSSGGVSTGAAIGIGVGSAAFALLAAGSVGLFFFTRWRRKKRLRRRGTTGIAGTRSSKGDGGGGGLSSRNGPPVPPKDVQPYYELSEEACSYVAASTAASDRGHQSSRHMRHMSMFSDSRSTGTSGATPPPGQPAEPERAYLSPVWQSPSQSPSRSPSYAYGRPVEHPGHQFAELEAVVPMEAASSDMPSSAEPSLMIPSRWQSLQSLKSCTVSLTPTTNLQDLPGGGTISSTMTGTGGMESVTNSWASRGRYGERGMSPAPWI
ncbi:hypothetical protein B0H65DRAFT_202929 [Neurospora tetraspora]|uniref:Uncharacterized protein n=1 Tax=Neurospora tetraspora TaxID=94610 RepID=A0AAE0JFH4_9PEZI|nr:hypothetical protein B0H65DRAFT_202929 [Neurospora tetraspora]